MELSRNEQPLFEEGKELDKSTKITARVRKLERQNKSLVVGIIGAVGVLSVIIVVLVVIMRPSDCENSKKSPEKESVSKQEPFKIGLLFASTGARSASERSLKAAALMAIKDLTDSQKGLDIITFQEDTESSPKKALRAFKKIYNEEHVKLFVGLSNSEAVEVAAWAEKNTNDTLILTPHATTAELTKYSNVIQLTMTNQALAYALHSQLTETKVSELIPIVRDDPHSLEIVDELNTIVGSLMNKLQVNDPIKYSSENLEKTAGAVLARVKTALIARPNASIFLVGQNEVKLLLEAAHGDSILLGRMWYASDSLALNHVILNSSKALNTSQAVSLYSFVYAGDQFGKSKKRGRTFARLSELLDEPPTLQAAMAYDAIQILYNTARATNSADASHIKSELNSKEDWGSGLSGQISIDARGQRISGDYLRVVVCPNIPDDKMVQVMMDGKWYIEGTTRVSKTDFMSKYGKRSADDDGSIMSQVLSMTSSNTFGMSSGAVVNRSELFELEGYLNSSCSDARIKVETIDPFSFRKVVKDYTKASFPNLLVLPAVYGYQMHMSCQTPIGQLTYEVACPPSESPEAKKECVGLLTKPKGRRKLLLSGATTGAIATCVGASVGCGVCAGVLGFFTFGIAAAACIGPCAVGIGGACTAATALGIKEGSGTVICTELLEQGQLPLHLYLNDVSFGKRLGRENSHVFQGYHALAKPIVWLMRRSELATDIVKIFALPWAEEMSHREREETTSNNLGRLVMNAGVPLCTVVGYALETWEAVVAGIPWGMTSFLGSLLILGVPFYHFKKTC